MLKRFQTTARLLMIACILTLIGPATVSAVPSGPACTFLGLPVCCFCAWSCTVRWSSPTVTTGKDVEATANTNCCASCCPDVSANPQTATCTIQTKRKYTFSVSGGLEVDPVEFGLEAGWESETVAGTECSANCTDCNTGHCDGGFNTKTTTWNYSEQCYDIFGDPSGTGSGSVTITELTSVYCDSTTGSCGRGTDSTGGVTPQGG